MNKKLFFIVCFLMSFFFCSAQELFTYTEPASNMASRSIGIRLNNTLMYDNYEKVNSFHSLPEIMIGMSKKIMVHGEGFLSNRNKSFVAEGGSVYLKYRFFSSDEVHSHFRMAFYGRYAFNNSDIHQQAIDLNGHNSGYELGYVATKLINKTALSASYSFVHADDNANNNVFIYPAEQRDAMAYTLSIGKLMLPKQYTSYKQVNLNAMVEFLGQTNFSTGRTFVDVAPVIQFIILSKMRVDMGYRICLDNTLYRTSPQGGMLRVEYNLFNAF
jgi:hypothetical protein